MQQRVHPRRLGGGEGGEEEKKGETHSLFEGWITQEREREMSRRVDGGRRCGSEAIMDTLWFWCAADDETEEEEGEEEWCWGSVQREYFSGGEKLSEKRGLCCGDSGRKSAFTVLCQHDCGLHSADYKAFMQGGTKFSMQWLLRSSTRMRDFRFGLRSVWLGQTRAGKCVCL